MSLLRRKSKVKESPSTSAQGSVDIPCRDPYLLEYKENLTVKVRAWSNSDSNLYVFVVKTLLVSCRTAVYCLECRSDCRLPLLSLSALCSMVGVT